MHHVLMDSQSKREGYEKALLKITAMLDGETDTIAQMASVSAILANQFEAFYWTGFYRMVNGELIVGPYQGTLGCLRISLDRGVCGAAATQAKTLIVDDVHDFPGHIACDARSRSEIVVPVINAAGELIAVLDVDSEQPAAFDTTDQEGLEGIVKAVFN